MNDMTPIAVRLTADHAKTMLEEAGALNVHVVGRGLKLLAFFEARHRRQAWIIRGNGWVHNFAIDVIRELKAQ